jgi:ABC-type Fe3+-hydroxamate transport system substrate-binding protein
VEDRQHDLKSLLERLKESGATVMGLGASTKGNVLVMTTPVTQELMSKVGDVNPYKYGRFLPGSQIPIVSEEEVLAENPDYLLILPWHFRETFMDRLQPYLAGGGRLIFPLPDLEVVGY